eukprot:156696_1
MRKNLDYGDFHSMTIKLEELCKHTSSVQKGHVQELNRILMNYVKRIAEKIQYELPQTTYSFVSVLERFDIISEEDDYNKWQFLWNAKYPNGKKSACSCDDNEDYY